MEHKRRENKRRRRSKLNGDGGLSDLKGFLELVMCTLRRSALYFSGATSIKRGLKQLFEQIKEDTVTI
eukprot:2809663-Amphidinium_carterae.1